MSFVVTTSVNLKAYNTMAVPAVADYLSSIENIDDIIAAQKFAAHKQLPVMVLGEGSNTLFTEDYNGLILVNQFKGIDFVEDLEDSVVLRVAGGENWHEFVAFCMSKDWFGLENLALIPGSVGAAPIQNIGAYGVEMKDYVVAVEYLDLATQKTVRLVNRDCNFAYRDSVFKNRLKNKVVITSVIFRLAKRPRLNITYPALSKYFSQRSSPSAQQVFSAVCNIRNSKLPLPQKTPNLGSFFKNPIVSQKTHDSLRNKFPSLVSFSFGNDYKLAAGWLIEEAGWKHKVIDEVAVHHAQALVIINPRGAPGKSVLRFALAVQSDIKRKFGVLLEIEPQLV